MSSPAFALSACAACGASTPLVCASCLKAVFCSPACAAAAWAGHRAACADFSVLAELPEEAVAPVPPAAPLASLEPAAGAGAGAPAFAGSGFACAVCGSPNAAVCARCRLVGYCGAAHQRKDWPSHKAVCRKGEFGVAPVLSWEQRILAEAHAAAPASIAATAALPPLPAWDLGRDGVPPTKIMRNLRKAADGGHALAQHSLGFCYEFAKGVAKDHKTAVKWYAKAAAQGNAQAQSNLGVCYVNGTGVAQDATTAFEWIAKAAAQGFAKSQCILGTFFCNGTGVAENAALAFEWYAKAAAQGNAQAQHNVGAFYANGKGVARDDKAALAWFSKAEVQGDFLSQFALGQMHEHGKGVAKDFAAAAAWYAKAAASGHPKAPACRDACLARAAAAASR
jgi:TPR repeat protein